MTEAQKKATRLATELANAKAEVEAERGRRKIKCSCGKYHPINTLHLIISHWYTQPHGCTGGDYWSEGDWRFVCPTTNVINRLYFNDFDRPWKERGTSGAQHAFKSLYRWLFKSEESTHQHTDPPAVNNSYVDENRKRFELPAKYVCQKCSPSGKPTGCHCM